jgi:thioredoxin reductase (NADPH)
MKDILIIWTWAAWLASAVYAKRYELDITVVWNLFWWTVTKTHLIENWPWTKSTSWFELGMNLMEHAKHVWAEIKMWEVKTIVKNEDWSFESELANWEKIQSKTLIYATWAEHRELWLESEQRLKNKWVSYCVTCDWAFFKEKIVWIVWWSDSAVKESLLLSEYASKVYIIYRKENPRAEPINMKRMKENNKIEVIWNSNITEVLGENAVSW